MSVTIKIDLKEIARFMCRKCRAKLKQYLKEKIAEQISENLIDVDKIIGLKKDKEGEGDADV